MAAKSLVNPITNLGTLYSCSGEAAASNAGPKIHDKVASPSQLIMAKLRLLVRTSQNGFLDL